MRGSDLARLMVTLGIGLMLFEVANQAAFITGGADGLSGVTMGKLFGVFAFDLRGSTAYLYSLGVLFLLFVVARRIVTSPFGLSLRGVRENVKRMPAIGAPVTRRLIAIYTVSAAMAGVAGGLLAQTTQFVGLDVFGFPRSADLMIMLVLGGAGRLYGGLVGATVFMIAHHYLSDLNPIYWQFWLGLLLVVVVLFGRGGILGALDGSSRPAPEAAADDAPRCAPRAVEAVRRVQGGERRHARVPAGRAARADRPERRRQDDAHQPAHRRARRRPRATCSSATSASPRSRSTSASSAA